MSSIDENFNLTINNNLPPINSHAFGSIDAVALFKYKVYKNLDKARILFNR